MPKAFAAEPGPDETAGLSADIFRLSSIISLPARGSTARISTA